MRTQGEVKELERSCLARCLGRWEYSEGAKGGGDLGDGRDLCKEGRGLDCWKGVRKWKRRRE